MSSIRQAVREGAQAIKNAPTPRDHGTELQPLLDSGLILAFVLGTRREELLARYSDAVEATALRNFRRLIERRAAGIPVAYIVGRKEFWGLSFRSDERALIPRPETELIVELALDFHDTFSSSFPGRTIRIHDACTGSGAIAVAIKKERPSAEISVSDISSEALSLARENAKEILGEDNDVLFYESDWLASVPGSFDILTANPPYVDSLTLESIKAMGRNEPITALHGGEDGLEAYRSLAPQIYGKLADRGRAVLEIGDDQAVSVRDILIKEGFQDFSIWKDIAGRDRALTAAR